MKNPRIEWRKTETLQAWYRKNGKMFAMAEDF